MSKSYEMDLCSGKITPKMIKFTLPIIFSSLLQLLFNAADIVVVGRFEGDTALSAVGSNTALINLLTTFFMGLSVGVNVLVANYYGGKKKDMVSKAVHTAVVLAIISGLILSAVGVIFAEQFLIWMNTPDSILEPAAVYLRVYFLGMVAMMVYNFGSSVLRAVGDTKRPLYYLMIAGVVNVLLNLLLVVVFGLGVAGVALATVASQCLSAFLVLLCLAREKSEIRLEVGRLKLDGDILKSILRIGLPASIQGIMFSASNVIIQASVNEFGDIVVGGNTAGASIEGFVYVSMNAFYQAAISFVSQNIGAGKKERIGSIMLRAQGMVIAVGLILGNLAVLFGSDLVGIYTDKAEMIEYGVDRINVICRTYCLCGMMDVMVGGLRGMGYSITPTIVSLVGICGFRLAWIFTAFRMEEFHSPFWLYITYPVSWIVTFSAHLLFFIIFKRRMLQKTDIKSRV